MLNLLTKVIPVYVNYTTKDGNSAVRARTWHPSWFIPVFKIWFNYWLGFWKRYKSYQATLHGISLVIHNLSNELNPVEMKLDSIREILDKCDCGFECEYVETYGFVPEAGCPIHD